VSARLRTVSGVLRVTWVDDRGKRWLVEIARTRRERARGLLGRSHLPLDHALLLERARSVHTFGMRFAIDAVLLDATYRVLRMVHVRPGRLVLPRPGVRHVLETASAADISVGEVVQAIQVAPVVPVTDQPSDEDSS
jgi:uncharacterized membrane protein (UPF0127 family)